MIVIPDAKDRTIVSSSVLTLDKAPELDGRTNRQINRDYYSGLHCQQCGRPVKTRNTLHI